VAHSLSAKKRIRQNEKKRARNKARRDIIKDDTKAFNAAVVKGDVAEAGKALNVLVSTLDRVKTKSTIHKNTAARRRSRLTKRLNALAKAGPKPAGKTTGKSKGTKA
jgi:small subunit ribosomal protein S20